MDELTRELVDFLSPRQIVAVLPDRRTLPRRMKKAWDKMVSGRLLTAGEWRFVAAITARRRKGLKYVRIPMDVRVF
jgi:hypothetical protein